MKKITAILVCLLLVSAIAVTAFAAAPEMTIAAAKTSVTRGETVDFTITLSEVKSLRSAMIDLTYDKNVFEFVEGACTVAGAALPDFSNGNGVFMMNSATDFSGQIFTFKMKVKADAAFGEATITGVPTVRDANGAIDSTANTVTMNVVCASHTEETKVTEEATCEKDGTKVTTCKDCGATIKTEPVAKLGHKWDAGTVTTAATCEADGVKTFTCENGCGKTQTEAVEKLGHKWDAGTVTTAATCAAEGVKTFTCENGCGKTQTEAVEKLPHTPGAFTETKAPTCAAEGEKTATCSVCQGTVTEAIAALPHTLDEGVVTKAPTTKKEGVKTYTCTVCGGTVTESIPKLQSPGTGDNSMIFAFVLLMVLSAAGVAVTVIGKKKVA